MTAVTTSTTPSETTGPGRSVLVTAGAAGIGRAIAGAFQRLGDRVAVCDIDAAAVVGASSAGLDAACLDVTDEVALAGWVDHMADAFGGVDVLVNNAGIAGPTAFVEDVTVEEWDRCLAVCLRSHYVTSARVAPVMKRQRAGSIINISSMAGMVGYGMRTPYAAAKWAVIGLTKSLAIELGPFNVRVNAICPGSVAGPRMVGVIARDAAARGIAPETVEAEYLSGQSIARFVEPEEVADLCVFLASDAARMMSGQAVAVDGHTETYHLG